MALSTVKPGTSGKRGAGGRRTTASTNGTAKPRAKRAAPAATRTPRRRPGKVNLADYPPELVAKVAAIEQKLASTASHEVRAMVDIGREMQAIFENPTLGVTKFKEIAPLFTMGRNEVRPCYALAERYTDTEIDRLLSLKHKETGAGLNRAHLTALSRVPDKTEAYKLAQKAIEHGWGKRELVAEVTKYRRETGERRGGGRTAKGAENLRELFAQIGKAADDWIKREMTVWRAKGTGLEALLSKAYKDGTDQATVTELDQTIVTLGTFETKLRGVLADLIQASRRLTVGDKKTEAEDA